MNEEQLFVRAAQLRYDAVRQGAGRSWEELGEANQQQWISVMRSSAAALLMARRQLNEHENQVSGIN